MSESSGNQNEDQRPELAIDPDVLARELEAELVGDPLDDIAPDDRKAMRWKPCVPATQVWNG